MHDPDHPDQDHPAVSWIVAACCVTLIIVGMGTFFGWWGLG